MTEYPSPSVASPRRFTFILNPAAGHGVAGRRRGTVEQAVAASGLSADLVLTEGPGHARELAQRSTADVVVAVGGDGTVQEVSQGLIAAGRGAVLGVVPLGTGNDFVKMIRMPRTPKAAVEALRHARPRRVDYGRVRWWDDDHPGEATFVNAVGIGFDAQVADEVAGFKFLPGLTGYLAAALRTLRRWHTPDVHLTLTDGGVSERYDGPLLLTTAGNGICSGGGFYLTPGASITDGRFDVCIIEGISIPRILQLIPTVFFGRHIHAREVHMHHAERLHLETSRPLPVHADGELLTRTASRLEAEVVPGGLSVLVPDASP